MVVKSSAYNTDDKRWAAVEARERQADGAFFSAVKTTGVVCRPSCLGRPLRRNVSFYDALADALGDGYRVCKRCKPEKL